MPIFAIQTLEHPCESVLFGGDIMDIQLRPLEEGN